MANIYDMSDTWNDGATTFTAIKMDVTDTASDAASLLMDLQVGGSSKFSVAKSGIVTAKSGFRFSDDVGQIFIGRGAVGLRLGGATIYTTNAFGVGAADCTLSRDAANTLAQRNSTNAQTFNLYNTYTDASNYERGVLKWNSNVLEIGMEAAGTGNGSRNIAFRTGGSTPWRIVGVGGALEPVAGNQRDVGTAGSRTRSVYVGTSIVNSGYEEFAEMTAPAAPASNAVRIYAEDDGAGKTRLMALFPTGAAQQIAIEP